MPFARGVCRDVTGQMIRVEESRMTLLRNTVSLALMKYVY